MLDAKVIDMKPGKAKWAKLLSDAHAALAMLVEERTDYQEERSENWQDSDNGQDFMANTDELERIKDELEGLEL